MYSTSAIVHPPFSKRGCGRPPATIIAVDETPNCSPPIVRDRDAFDSKSVATGDIMVRRKRSAG
jgi:hypothetical protein